MKKIGKYLIIISSLVFFISCEGEGDDFEVPVPAECKNIKWDYSQDDPKYWGSLCGEFTDCAGDFQSPIALNDTSVVQETDSIQFFYTNSTPDMVYDDFTITFTIRTVSKVNKIKIGGDNGSLYKLSSFHFHVPAEHTINDKTYPIEIHFVHVNEKDNSDYAHLSVFIEEGEENPFFKLYEEKFSDPSFKGTDPFELGNLIPKNKSFYKYQGSMTAPPCTENVTWFVLKNPIKCSSTHIGDMEDLFYKKGNNSRGILPQGDRVIYEFKDEDNPTE